MQQTTLDDRIFRSILAMGRAALASSPDSMLEELLVKVHRELSDILTEHFKGSDDGTHSRN